jgi:hypothetical protein
LAAGVQQNQFAVDQWDVSYLSIANVGTPSFLFPNLGPGLKGSQASYLPAAQLLQTVNGQTVCGHGESAVPYGVSPSLTAGGSLTSGAKYQWMVSVDMPDENGNVWRSPAGLPSTQITPSAGNLSVSIVIRVSPFECGARKRVIKLWRTSGNGFVFQLVKELTDFAGANATITVSDGLADTALAGSSFYPFALPGQAGGELPPTITPAASHIEQFDGRMFIVDRDFPSRVRYTKPIAQGISPEFPDEFQINIVDSDGDITGLQALDDKLVIRKLGAVYIVPAGGPNNDGSGTFYQALRVSSTVGSVSGTPAVSTGEENWFFSQFGVYRMNRSLGIDFVGEPVDQFFNQPQIFFPDVPLSMTFNHAANQIRILTTSFRLIYDTIHQVWHRDIFPGDDRGGSGYTMFMIETAQGDMFFRATGEVWFDTADDGASTTTDPNGVLVSGLIRSPWMRPADVEGWVRLYEARSVYLKGPNGGLTAFPQMLVYANNGEGGTDTGARSGTTNPTEQRLAFRPKGAPKVSAFSIAVQLPGGDQSWRLDLWTVLVGVGKRGMAKLSPAQRLASQ